MFSCSQFIFVGIRNQLLLGPFGSAILKVIEIIFSQAPAAGTVLGGGIKDDPAAMARARAAANNAVQQGFMQPSIDVSNMDEKTQQIYLLKMTIQEVSLKLNQPNLGKLLHYRPVNIRSPLLLFVMKRYTLAQAFLTRLW